MVLNRLLQEDYQKWDKAIADLHEKNRLLRVPSENNTTTLLEFNVELNDLFSESYYWFSKARRNKDAIERLIENTLNDNYQGANDRARKAAGIQYARQYPTHGIWHEDHVNLFDLEDELKYYHYSLDAIIKILHAKSDAKITNNSLLNLENKVTPY